MILGKDIQDNFPLLIRSVGQKMKIGRVGEIGHERPVVVEGDYAYFVDSIIPDWSRESLQAGAVEKVRALDLKTLEKAKFGSQRIAAPLTRPTKLICVGLNYIKHITETNASKPVEPIIFMKAPDAFIGPNDDVVIPPGSTATDYEVELAVIIGTRALYLKDPSDAAEHILGYSVSQDISERHWQLERSGQWVKGKSFPHFNPIGPVIVTADSLEPHDLRLWCSVDGEMRQDSSTSDLLFGINHLVWYISQFMELFPGDVINTGTPAGVGMGFKPTKYLTAGQVIHTGIENIGEIRSNVVNYSA
jgi:2-keto-4-pentenoate hydratase/2-oxohepta-3-ene-1,7-dioic acid hydratase in catechol pathway